MAKIQKKLKVLFLCDFNRQRSATAEKVFASHPALQVRSAGIAYTAEHMVTPDALEWADVVFVMEERQHRVINALFTDISSRKRIECLYIPDEYPFMDPQLVCLLQEKVLGRLVESGLVD